MQKFLCITVQVVPENVKTQLSYNLVNAFSVFIQEKRKQTSTQKVTHEYLLSGTTSEVEIVSA